MKIAFIVTYFPKLSHTFILNQITGLLDLGHDIKIFAELNPKESKVHSDVEKYNLLSRVQYYGMPQNILIRLLKASYLVIANFHRSPIKLLRSLNFFKHGKDALSLKLLYILIPFLSEQFDIIQCHFGHCGNLGAFLKQIDIKGKLVTMFHGYDIRLVTTKGENFYRDLFKVGDCFLAISNYNYENLILFGLNPKKIIYHTVGINLNKFYFQYQTNSIKPPNTIKLITVARLVEEKGLSYGIRAINNFHKRNPDIKLQYNIVGEGESEGDLKKLVKQLDLEEVVNLIGPMDQEGIIREMRQAHIFLLPSIAEALPVVLMEAQAVGLPVIATSVGSVSQIVIDGKSGFLVPAREVDSIVKRLEYIIEHPELWSVMGRFGRKLVEERYDIRKLNQRLEKIFAALLSYDSKLLKDLGSCQ
ncbi:glycosyltransferase [Desulfobacterota bacterium AH_259_B03_O07]|nr:glycosyltransferase [Desulfobacterota bacterium AH_259_B03_O07]